MSIVMKTMRLDNSFQDETIPRNRVIICVFRDGYTQDCIAEYLNLSVQTVSRIIVKEQAKEKLFDQMKTKGLFWSYDPGMDYDPGKDELLAETVLKYADIDDIKTLFTLYGKRWLRKLWKKQLKNDSRFKKLNYFLARVFFGMNVEASDFAEVKNDRTEKLRLFAEAN
jgi:hypothetical protein